MNVQNQIEEIIKQYSSSLYRVIYMYCKNKSDAEDIVQNAFLKLYCSQKQFESSEYVKNWLFRVAINEAINVTKSKWHHYEELETEKTFSQPEYSNVYHALRELPKRYKGVVLLYYYCGYSTKEIGSILGISESAVSTRLQRARKKMKAVLED